MQLKLTITIQLDCDNPEELAKEVAHALDIGYDDHSVTVFPTPNIPIKTAQITKFKTEWYVTHKKTRLPNTTSYYPAKWNLPEPFNYKPYYTSRNEALQDAQKLNQYNPVGFTASKNKIKYKNRSTQLIHSAALQASLNENTDTENIIIINISPTTITYLSPNNSTPQKINHDLSNYHPLDFKFANELTPCYPNLTPASFLTPVTIHNSNLIATDNSSPKKPNSPTPPNHIITPTPFKKNDIIS